MTEHCVYCSVCILSIDLLVKSWRIVEKDMRNSSVKVLGMLLSSGTCECYRWKVEGVYKWRHRGKCHTSALPNAFTAVLVFFSGMLIYRKRAWFSQQNHFIRYQFVNIVDTQGSVWQEREMCVCVCGVGNWSRPWMNEYKRTAEYLNHCEGKNGWTK